MKQFLLLLLLSCNLLIKAQQNQSPDTAYIDTTGTQSKDSTIKPLIHIADSLTTSDYLMSIDRVNDKLNAISDSAKLGFEVVIMGRRTDEITDDLTLLRKNIRDKQTMVNIKNLYLYQSFAQKLDKDNNKLQEFVTIIYNRVYQSKRDQRRVFTDSVFHLILTDESLQGPFKNRLNRLERKWLRNDSTIKSNIDSINSLKVKLADNSITLSTVLNMANKRLDKANQQLFGPEFNSLWEKNEVSANQPAYKIASTILSSEHKAIGYYISQTSGERTFVVILGIILFIWLYFKQRFVKTIRIEKNSFDFLHLQYINKHPILSIIALLLCLMPFFDAYAPTSYIALEHFILLTVASLILFRNNNMMKVQWFTLVALFVVNILTYLLIEPSFISRLWQLLLHLAIITSIWIFYKKTDNNTPYWRWIKKAAVVSIVLTTLAVITNLFGRVSLSGILGLVGIFSITHAVVLPVFIDTIMEIVLLQLQISRLKKGVEKQFDSSFVSDKIKTPLLVIAIILWIIMLASNLNIYHNLSNNIWEILTITRTFGSVSFKLISVLLFFIIIWAAHILQRLISFLFGETGIETEDQTAVSKGQHSRLLITRLLVLVGGYLLAIAVSGLPIDRLTIILGALGVGIGMGLQNIVNNFVSGIILIFDGSLQIGDEIEVSGQSGKVKEIGLRASTLNTADGAEVIIPNGNILSQNIVNWTFSNDQKRVMIQFLLKTADQDANMIIETINETIGNMPNANIIRKPVILFTKVTQESCSLSVQFWSTISNANQAKSDALLKLNKAFRVKNIGFE